MDPLRTDRETETRAIAERFYRQGWRAFPFVVGALTRKPESQSRAQVSGAIWQALREYENDVLTVSEFEDAMLPRHAVAPAVRGRVRAGRPA